MIKAFRSAAIALLLAGTSLVNVSAARAQVLTNVVPEAAQMSFQAKIRSIDPATRQLVLVSQSGEAATVTAGPLVRLQMLKAGDTVNATYYRAVAFMVSQPGQKVPEDQIAAALARPAKAPGGVVLKETRISGLVVGIDLSNYTIQVVEPAGGGVETLAVTNPSRRAHLHLLKVGDTVTAVVSEALAITVTPAS